MKGLFCVIFVVLYMICVVGSANYRSRWDKSSYRKVSSKASSTPQRTYSRYSSQDSGGFKYGKKVKNYKNLKINQYRPQQDHSNEVIPSFKTAVQPNRDQEELKAMVKQVSLQVKSLQTELKEVKNQNTVMYRKLKKLGSQCTTNRTAKSDRKCPNKFEWNKWSGTCYRFEAQRTSWRKAQAQCSNMGAKLVSVTSFRDQEFIRKKARESSRLRHCDFWTGATDAKKEGEWIWSGINKPLSFTYWRNGEPNNSNNNEHCMQMLWVFGWAWIDAHCNLENACFVCEKDASS